MNLNHKTMKKVAFIVVLMIYTIITITSCNNYSVRVRDISQDIIDYETQRIPSIIQQCEPLLYGKELKGITVDSLVIYGCNSINDELSEDLAYNGYFITTWSIEKTNRYANSTEEKTIYVNVSDLTIKKDGRQYSYEWQSDYMTGLRSIMME